MQRSDDATAPNAGDGDSRCGAGRAAGEKYEPRRRLLPECQQRPRMRRPTNAATCVFATTRRGKYGASGRTSRPPRAESVTCRRENRATKICSLTTYSASGRKVSATCGVQTTLARRTNDRS